MSICRNIRRRIQVTVNRLSSANITTEILEIGEDLAIELGKVLEVKIQIERLRDRAIGNFMKELPDEKILLELLSLAQEAEQKAKELCDLAEFDEKWRIRLKATTEQPSIRSNA